MQCVACRAVYSNTLDACPRCRRPASSASPAREKRSRVAPRKETKTSASTDGHGEVRATAHAPAVSTLIEFPGSVRAARPQWRKELSERVREIQQRRAREAAEAAAQEAEEAARRQAEQLEEMDAAAAPQLGLVPPPADAPALNPLVAAALRRIERARQSSPPPSMSCSNAGGAAATAAAVARVAEENYDRAVELKSVATTRPELRRAPAVEKTEKPAVGARPSGLAVVPPHLRAKTAALGGATAAKADATDATTPPANKPAPRRVYPEVVDDALLARRDAEGHALSVKAIYDDRAPLASRFVGGVMDILLVAFFSSPFAAIIELTSGNWADPRVIASVCGIVAVVMFLYLTGATALAGRTWGMSLLSLRMVDSDTALAPTTGQAARSTFIYMLSLATFGIGILYALFDAEGRAAHDRLSGTVVVRE